MALPNLVQIKQALDKMMPELTPVPVGTIDFAHDVPEGWLECNGAAVSRTKYARLFKKIGTKYGAGDGSTTFNLPNLHHRVLEGTNTTSEVAQYQEAGLPDISGDLVFSRLRGEDTLECYGAFSSASGVTGLYKLEFAERDQSLPSAKASFKASRSNAILGKSQTLQTNALRLMAIIKS